LGMGRGDAATWPTRKREKKKARTAEGENNIAVRRKRVDDRRLVGFGGGRKTIDVNWVEPAAGEMKE